ncbi:uncharacterized protein LOC143249592 isoform X1 [Tachypleus tridentatus]|uniref:uncharacterized protein LOC143249592 isoform X1 n=2 Tax=Tachypleus tridentatus TaxID=6853 RepID=UPI003FD182E7
MTEASSTRDQQNTSTMIAKDTTTNDGLPLDDLEVPSIGVMETNNGFSFQFDPELVLQTTGYNLQDVSTSIRSSVTHTSALAVNTPTPNTVKNSQSDGIPRPQTPCRLPPVASFLVNISTDAERPSSENNTFNSTHTTSAMSTLKRISQKRSNRSAQYAHNSFPRHSPAPPSYQPAQSPSTFMMMTGYNNLAVGYFLNPEQHTKIVSTIDSRKISSSRGKKIDREETTLSSVHVLPTMHLDILPSPGAASVSSPGSQTLTLSTNPSPSCSSFSGDLSTSSFVTSHLHGDCNQSLDNSPFMNSSSCHQPVIDTLVNSLVSASESIQNFVETSSDNFLNCQDNVLDSLLSASSSDQLFNSVADSDLMVTTTDSGSVLGLPDIHFGTQEPSVNQSDISSILLQPQETLLTNPVPDPANRISSDLPSTSNNTTVPYLPCTSVQEVKEETTWSRYSLLPSIGNIQTNANEFALPYNNVMAPSSTLCQYSGTQSSLSGFHSSCAEMYPPASNFVSPRHSARSSFSGRGSRATGKRALSISPLSSDGLDLNTLIRISPTSLVFQWNGSRSSSASMSPASGERHGCYGHLSARNSSSSPHSGSGSSAYRMSISYTPQTNTSVKDAKDDVLDIDSHFLACQDMQNLEQGNYVLSEEFTVPDQVIIPQNNLQVVEQQDNMFKTEQYDGGCMYSSSISAPFRPPPPPPPPLPPLSNRPPPSYDQHMARKIALQKKSSSDSSHPSSYSSFDSSEGDRLVEGNDSDQGAKQHHVCRWIDCSAVFSEQEDLVKHIEKAHVDQRKGEDFTCFWQGCTRRFRPFNARYKLLIHMRVHSGEKPNKCKFEGCNKSFSRLENLKIHLRSHTGERPYVCQYEGCSKAFSNSSDRAKHQRTHQDTKPYACQIPGCSKRYTDPSSLRKHQKNHQPKIDPVRKKLRGGPGEMDPQNLRECLTIQPIRINQSCGSPPLQEHSDNGLGRSSLNSLQGSSSDSYPGITFIPSNHSSRSISNHTSPVSHQGSPALTEITESNETRQQTNTGRRVPMLPPIGHNNQQVSRQDSSQRLRPQSLVGRPLNSNNEGSTLISLDLPTNITSRDQARAASGGTTTERYSTYLNSIGSFCSRLPSRCQSDLSGLPAVEDFPSGLGLDAFSHTSGIS